MALNQPDISPAVAEAIYRQLRGAPGGHLSEETVRRRVVPDGLGSLAGTTMFVSTLRELKAIAALVDDATGNLALNARDGRADATSMAAIIRQAAMDAERDRDVWERDEDGYLVLTGALDFVRAIAWLLSLPLEDAPYAWQNADRLSAADLQRQQLPDLVVLNEERWRPFTRWAVYLGFATNAGGGLIPDPTRAVREALRAMYGGRRSEWVTFDRALDDLAGALPVLDTGIYRRAVVEHGAPGAGGTVSASLTLAFRRLEKAKDIQLDVGAGDAAKVVFANNEGAYHALRWTTTA